MQESIIIKNFGPIKDIEINNIRPFTVFIGESGSGKSTIIKVIVLFRWIYKWLNIRSYLKHANISELPFSFDFKELLRENGLSDYLIPDSSEIIYKKGNTTIRYNSKLAFSPIIPKDELSLDKMCFISDKRNLIPDILSGNKSDLSFYLKETYDDFNISKDLVKELNFDYLGVRYVSQKTSLGIKYFIESLDKNEKYKIKLENASSGIQTQTPLAVIIKYFSEYYNFPQQFNRIIFDYLSRNDSLKDFRAELNIGDIKHKSIHFHIEEPELSLYPESQRSLINYIVDQCFVKQYSDYNTTVMMATHSPYIINHLNLLIKAFDKNKLIEGAKLAYDDISVYQVANGCINDLKIQNKKLIYTNPLSDTINNIYDEYNQL
ncbi:AAA family ATPase [Bacteroidales bacterium OttesenSCG-928-C03]|nr:AAA family ATPase [Bacteroidales bacterium OttesenSCG-928-E04]MDL2309073.1 AAA family ATPase [Bacteroidales bacterium OttesenSCG-928-C03]